jgi:hypothetical protein
MGLIKDKARIKGKVTAAVTGNFGEPRYFDLQWARDLYQSCGISKKLLRNLRYIAMVYIRELLSLKHPLMIAVIHNLVTNQGDALLVDGLSTTPARTLLNNANAVIGVGTGYTSVGKGTTGLTTQTGSDEAMDATYPKQKGAWGAANDSVIQFQSTFEAGDLNASGIDEAAVGNGTDNLAYVEISPALNVTAADTLAVLWEITFLGA